MDDPSTSDPARGATASEAERPAAGPSAGAAGGLAGAAEVATQSGAEAVVESDVDLMRRMARDEDREAFALLFTRYAGRVKAYLMRGGAPADVADEASQDVMVSVWRRAALYDSSKAGVSTWIFAIARNRRIDILRRETRAAPDPDDPLFQPDAPEDPETSAAAADRDAQVREAMRALGEDQRDVVRMAFFVGMTQVEIAEALDVPLGTVKSRMRLALGRLRSALGDEFAEELFDD
ncbi:MAG: RNA polymerase subunit sigma [Rhodobacteraceae bacterium]|nr:RNA polymerase subunit sigma [Paracoccaceae bacterium]MBR29352.1 RNA polymerase subunit sigma [Paracoccaceae bacterium]